MAIDPTYRDPYYEARGIQPNTNALPNPYQTDQYGNQSLLTSTPGLPSPLQSSDRDLQFRWMMEQERNRMPLGTAGIWGDAFGDTGYMGSTGIGGLDTTNMVNPSSMPFGWKAWHDPAFSDRNRLEGGGGGGGTTAGGGGGGGGGINSTINAPPAQIIGDPLGARRAETRLATEQVNLGNRLLSQDVIRSLLAGLGTGNTGTLASIVPPDYMAAVQQALNLMRSRQGQQLANEAAATGGAGSRDLAYRQSLLDEATMNSLTQAAVPAAQMGFTNQLQARQLQAQQQMVQFQNMLRLIAALGGGGGVG